MTNIIINLLKKLLNKLVTLQEDHKFKGLELLFECHFKLFWFHKPIWETSLTTSNVHMIYAFVYCQKLTKLHCWKHMATMIKVAIMPLLHHSFWKNVYSTSFGGEDQNWRTPKSRFEPTWGSNYVELRKVGTRKALPTSSIREG